VQKTGQATAKNVSSIREWTERHDQDDSRQMLIQWLDPTAIGPDQNLEAALREHCPGTGEWLTELEVYQEWSKADKALMWIYGIRQYSLAASSDRAN